MLLHILGVNAVVLTNRGNSIYTSELHSVSSQLWASGKICKCICKKGKSISLFNHTKSVCCSYLFFSLFQEFLKSFILEHTQGKVCLSSTFHFLELLFKIPQGLKLIIQSILSCAWRLEVQLQVQGSADRALLHSSSHDRLANRLNHLGRRKIKINIQKG